MKLSELRYGEHFSCRIEPYSNPADNLIDKQNPLGIILQKNTHLSDAYILQIGAAAKMVRMIKCSDISSLENRILAGQTNLYEVINILSNNQLDIEVVFFREYKTFPQPFIINVTEDFITACGTSHFCSKGKDGDHVCGILKSQFMLGSSSNSHFLYIGKTPGDDDPAASCTLVNKDWQLVIKSREIRDEISLYSSDIKRHIPRNNDNSVCLAKGELRFSYLSAETISKLNELEMKKNLDDGSSYIGEWDKYNTEIGKRLLEAARKVGYIVLSGKPEKLSNHEILFNYSYNGENKLGDFNNLTIETDTVDIVQELPDYLLNPNMTYEEWIGEIDKNLEQEALFQNKKKKKQEQEEKHWSNLNIIDYTQDTITIESKHKGLPKRGKNGELFMILSITGEKIQVERRRRARQNILKGCSQISNLGLILDGKSNLSSNIPSVSGTKRKLSDKEQKKVYEKIFEFEPTENQKKAINIALTTPDIAVIQGPPGTGKSTVICGIIESLNQDFQKDNNLAGKILVTSLQHDAVDNVTNRLLTNGLPTVKSGRSSSEDELSISTTQVEIKSWCQTVVKNIEKNIPAVIESAEFQNLRSLFLDYHKAPSTAMEIALLNGIKNLSSRFTTPEIIEKIDSILVSLDQDPSSDDMDMINCLYALRTDEVSFQDDGTKRAMELAARLREAQIPIPSCLSKACSYELKSDLSFLSDLENLQNELLEQYLPHEEFRRNKENAVIAEIVNEVSQRIQKYPFDPSEKKNMALADFIYELKNNPDGILNTLLSYNPVLAATVQQSEGQEINKARRKLGLDTDKQKLPYEYVIVDEAARVAPPDLLIPMAKGKHIILVGDHRQLPQQVDQDIEKKMEISAASREEIAFLNESTFERLFAQLDASKKITLDKQYRMHPLLGTFISKEFYEVHNPNEGFESPLKAEIFSHNLPIIANKAAIWCNVENERNGGGAENRDASKSRYRRGEAIVAAKLLKKWLDFDTEKKLTFGVISFYSAQCREIKKQLSSLGICTQKLQINEDYQYTLSDEKKNIKERLRIGTVDAFQGMEFDVVILCTVRTATEDRIRNAYSEMQKDAEEGLRKQQGLFGFLMSKNRLCVSMSRQKKVLVVIGDKNLFTSNIAESTVPELNHYITMCENNIDFGLVFDAKSID